MANTPTVIMYEGDNSVFVYKHPVEDFNSLTQLIVHETQEAVFFMNGEALDVFGPGRHTLETENLPLVGKKIKFTSGSVSPFHCEVFFINKAEQMGIKWGTDSKVQYIEPVYGFPIGIGASGEMSLRVNNSKKLLTKVVGTEAGLTQLKMTTFFRSFMMTRVKSYIAQVIKQEKINIFEIDEHLTDFSDGIKQLLKKDFDDYGVTLERFFVTNVVKPDGEPHYERFKDLHYRQYTDIAEAQLKQQINVINAQTKAQTTVIESQALATKRRQEGYTYQQERGFDVAQEVARNEAIGQYTNLGVGLGTMAGVGGAVGGAVGNAVNDSMGAMSSAPETSVCAKCGQPLPANAKFCLNCGEKVVSQAMPEMVICPNCGQETPKGKFCLHCGNPLENTCPECGTAVPAGAKFCLNCGHKF